LQLPPQRAFSSPFAYLEKCNVEDAGVVVGALKEKDLDGVSVLVATVRLVVLHLCQPPCDCGVDLTVKSAMRSV
jgi:hypothetical protein